MTLCPDDIETASFQGPLFFCSDIGFDLADFFLIALVVQTLFNFIGNSHVQIAAQLNICTATGHVCGNGDGTGHPGLRDNVGFLLVIASVQHVVLYLFLLQMSGEEFRLLDGCCAHQYRLAAPGAVFQFENDRIIFFACRPINLVIFVNARNVEIGWNFQNFKPVNVLKLFRLRQCRPGHAGKFFIKTEIVLEGDRRECLVFRLDGDLFFCFQCLMQAFGIATTFHHATGEFVDDDDFAAFNDVVLVFLKKLVGFQCTVCVVDEGDVLHIVERAFFHDTGSTQQHFKMLIAFFGEIDGPGLLVQVKIFVDQVGNDFVNRDIKV